FLADYPIQFRSNFLGKLSKRGGQLRQMLLKMIAVKHKNFRTARVSDRKSINLAKAGEFISYLGDMTGLPLTSYFLSDSDVKKLLRHRF
ncbi:MAG: hypothetical protein IJR58_00880, partial [Lachnospiraceae bacterium]|nr:hypothetical protein [Lachnospiraceae bacterium]